MELMFIVEGTIMVAVGALIAIVVAKALGCFDQNR